jgi:hypothetical protein
VSRPGQPLTRQRSSWTPDRPLNIDGIEGKVFRRRVNDGLLTTIVSHEPHGWHMSISFVDHRGELSRYPRWDEIADARYKLLPEDITMAMLLPPPENYVAVHDTTFHLHELAES